MRLEKGFTLIELMIVVAIIGILASIAMPSYMRYSQKAANDACLAETRGYVTGVMIALSESEAVAPFSLSSCVRIDLDPSGLFMTAFPANPGNMGVYCDLSSSTACQVTDTITN